jgi:hypothetical protein
MSLYNPGSAHGNFGFAAGELGVEIGWEIINASRNQPPADEDAQMTALITNLVSEDIGEALEDYLINNFKPAVIFKLADKLHIKVRKNELPQETAFNIAVKIKALKEKSANSR